ncbi:MAG: tetratricopeptide repeat protein [Candidatus Helarchaeota archaeon]
MDWFKLGEFYYNKEKYQKAIKYFRKSYLENNKDQFKRIISLIYIGNCLKFLLEFELADSVYNNALNLAKKSNYKDLIDEISIKIENIYISEEKNNKIGLLIKTIMRMFSNLATTKNWF